jgi:glyoxylase-like metal-dependent hydrolase (beta-lactamase superfamily II)
MKVKFIGAIQRVTGSCSWLKHLDIEFLVDCGMIQGEAHDDYENNKEFPFKARNIKFVLLTHAHIDHCGLIPKLYRDGFSGRIYCTRATAKLANQVLLDASRITRIYSEDDVKRVKFKHIDELPGFRWGKFFPIDLDLFINLFRSAHILGAVSIGISWSRENGKSILFSGDIGNNTRAYAPQPLIKYRHDPDQRFGYIVCESTYGGRSRDKSDLDFEYRISKLEDVIVETLHKKRGNLIIPAFSMHRTQEILFDLYYIFKVRWNESLKNGVYKVSLIDFLKHRGYLRDRETLSKQRLLQLRDFSEIPADKIDIILASYSPYYVCSEELYRQLKEKFLDFDSTDVCVESDQEKYRIYIKNNTALESSIDQFLQEHSNIVNKRYVFDESTFLILFKGDTEDLIEINELPVHV